MVSFWKWLTTPSKAKLLRRRADEMMRELVAEVDKFKASDNAEKFQHFHGAQQQIVQKLADEFQIDSKEAFAAIREAMHRAQVKSLFG
jgi:hypothetical protein